MSKKLAAILGLIAGLSMSSAALAAGPDLEKAQALLQAGKYSEAYSLLEPFEFEKSGDLTFDYLLGTAALNSGNPSKATFIFERILAQEPNYVGVRLDMGRAYYEMGDYARAKIEFETIIVFENLPPDLKSAAGQYLAAIQQLEQAKKTILAGYVEFGLGHNSNINSGVSQNPVYLPAYSMLYFMDPTGLKTPDRYLNLMAGLEINHQATDHISLYAGADVSGRGYDAHSASNYSSAAARAGLSVSSGAWMLRGGVNGSANLQHGVHNYDISGASVDVRYQVNQSNQLTASAQVMRLGFVDAALHAQNYDQSSMTIGWMHALGSGQTALTFSATGGSEQAPNGRDDGGKRFGGVRIGWQSSLTEKVGAFFSLGAQRSRYDSLNDTFLVNRTDNLYDLSAGVSWAFSPAWSLRPQVVYVRNDSNVLFNKYSSADYSLNLRRSF